MFIHRSWHKHKTRQKSAVITNLLPLLPRDAMHYADFALSRKSQDKTVCLSVTLRYCVVEVFQCPVQPYHSSYLTTLNSAASRSI